MIKLAYFENVGGVHFHRLQVPFDYISKEMRVSEVNYVPLDSHDFDVVVFNRMPNNLYPYGAIKKLKEQGVKIIYDIDDYWTRQQYNMNYDDAYETQYTIEILKYLRLADVVWCATEKLLELCRPFNQNCHYIPNALDYSYPMWQRIEMERTTPNFGWVGGLSHQYDFGRLRQHFDERFKAGIVLGGFTQEASRYWEFLGQVLSGGQIHKVKMYNALTPDKYGYLYNHLDIVVLPTNNDLFSSCKSNLKLLEAGSHKLPVITNGGYYKEVNGKIGLRITTPKDLKRAMNKLIESKSMRQELGEALHEYTSTKYDLHKINQLRIQTITQ